MDWNEILRLALPVAGLVGIVWLFLHYGTKPSATGAAPRIPSRDTLYISGYGVLIILELIVYVCLGNVHHDNIVDTIAFGATLSSLIMSVVAIIFTIVSGRDGREQLGRITQATDELRATASTFTHFTTVATSLSTGISQMDEKLSTIISQMDEKLSTSLTETAAIHTTVANRFAEDTNTATSTPTSDTDSVQYFVNTGSIYGNLMLLTCALARETSRTFEAKTLTNEYSSEYFFGYAIAAACAKIIQITGQWPDITVAAVAPNLADYCLNNLKAAIKAQTADDVKQNLLNLLNAVLTNYSRTTLTLNQL